MSIGIQELPAEVILNIMKYMDYETLVNITSTNKTMSQIGTEYHLWKEFTLSIPDKHKEAIKAIHHKRFKGIRKIKISSMGKGMKNIMKHIHKHGKIEELEIKYNKKTEIATQLKEDSELKYKTLEKKEKRMPVKAIKYMLKGDIIKVINIPENKIGRKGLKLLLSNKHQININLFTTMYIDTLVKERQQVKEKWVWRWTTIDIANFCTDILLNYRTRIRKIKNKVNTKNILSQECTIQMESRRLRYNYMEEDDNEFNMIKEIHLFNNIHAKISKEITMERSKQQKGRMRTHIEAGPKLNNKM